MVTRRRAVTALAGALLAPGVHGGEPPPCGDASDAALRRVAGARYEIAFRPVPAPIAAGAHFALDLTVCPRPGVAPPRALAVDAQMPEHRHGMNYRAVVTALGGARYRAEGLMFHMPGRWDLIFDVASAEGGERLVAPARIE